LYSAALWLMRGGAYSVQVTVEGASGTGTALVPVMAVATRRLALQKPLGMGLLGLGAFLFIGALTIVRAAVRESALAPGQQPDRRSSVPAWIATTTFEANLPPLPAGTYRVYADIVHESGFAQTLVATAEIGSPAPAWHPSDADDAWLLGNGNGETGNAARLADGSTMTWERADTPIVVDQAAPLRFAVRTADGKPAALEL